MSAFRTEVVEANRRLPPRTFDLPDSAWSTDYEERPKADTVVGMRRPTARDTSTARAEAAKFAWSMHPEPADRECRIDCFNDALITWMLARVLCQPDDAASPLLEQQEDRLVLAFTSEGLRYLWSKLDEWTAQESPLVRRASDADLTALWLLLEQGALERVSARRATAVRRYLGAALAELEDVGEEVVEEPEPSPGEDEAA